MKNILKNSRFATCIIFTVAIAMAAGTAAQAADQRPAAPESRLLQVVLLVGSLDGASNTEHIPENTIQALKDIETFLPYKSYRLLDTSLIRSNAHASSVLNGLDGRDYHLDFDFDTEKGEKGDRLVFRVFRMQARPVPPAPPKGGEESTEAPASPRPPTPPPAPPAPRADAGVISTSFTVEVGETIVVGTSKLNGGDKALLVLLTAIPQN